MRTPLWETSPGALYALLNAAGPINKADLYTLTLNDGTVYRWSGSDIALSGNGNLWTVGPGLQRSNVRFTVGVSVDDMRVTITDNVLTTINGKSLMSFIRAGGLIGARLQVDRAFWGPNDTAPVGAVVWFPGRIAEVAGGRYSAQLTVRSDLELLSVMVPREVYQGGCLNVVYDSACTLSRASFTATGAATTASDAARSSFGVSLAQAAGYFELGTITMTSGANSGITRSVKKYGSGSISVPIPWPFPVAIGDTYSVVAGCDSTQATCTSKFSNLPHFRGQPYIPAPETIL